MKWSVHLHRRDSSYTAPWSVAVQQLKLELFAVCLGGNLKFATVGVGVLSTLSGVGTAKGGVASVRLFLHRKLHRRDSVDICMRKIKHQ